MRRIHRPALPSSTALALRKKQARVDVRKKDGTINGTWIQSTWRSAVRTKNLKSVRTILETISDSRCMYCENSEGTDLEHFRPKTKYPEAMFKWENLLLGCSGCNRCKGDDFPMDEKTPLLLDPTREEPWDHLDFDPRTGNIVARFLPEEGTYSFKGMETVRILQLDRREAVGRRYKRSWRRIVAVLEELPIEGWPADELMQKLGLADEHGLLHWCFHGSGKREPAIEMFRLTHPELWDICKHST